MNDREQLRAYLASRDVACPECGYNLRGSADGVCSECGSAYRFVALLVNKDTGNDYRYSQPLSRLHSVGSMGLLLPTVVLGIFLSVILFAAIDETLYVGDETWKLVGWSLLFAVHVMANVVYNSNLQWFLRLSGVKKAMVVSLCYYWALLPLPVSLAIALASSL